MHTYIHYIYVLQFKIIHIDQQSKTIIIYEFDTNAPIRNDSNNWRIYKYDVNTDIVTKYLTKSLFSILLQLFLHQNLKRTSDNRFSVIIGSEWL